MTTRLTADFWVRAYLTRLRLATIPAYVTRHGDATSGVVLVKLARLDGTASLHQRMFDPMAETRAWHCVGDGAEADLDARLAREMSRDPDLWVIEIEDRAGRTLLEEPGFDG